MAKNMGEKRYAVYGVDKNYRFLWQACLVAGCLAAKKRWKQSKELVHFLQHQQELRDGRPPTSTTRAK